MSVSHENWKQTKIIAEFHLDVLQDGRCHPASACDVITPFCRNLRDTQTGDLFSVPVGKLLKQSLSSMEAGRAHRFASRSSTLLRYCAAASKCICFVSKCGNQSCGTCPSAR